MTHHGATHEEWDHFVKLGLAADLLPVVSNPDARISAQSTMRSLGKTPSRYNSQHEAVGIAKWTQHIATLDDIERWRQEPDYGICLQTRHVRALDCDIENSVLAKDVHDEIAKHFKLPMRYRDNAPKFLHAFILEGDYAKRTIRTEYGIIEFLATGQQFIAAGTHPSGARYEWLGGLPGEVSGTLPVLNGEDFERLWLRLEECFAIEPSTTSSSTTRHTKLTEAVQNDPIAQSLVDKGFAISTERDGRVHIECPFRAEHTTDSAESATTYFPAFTGGFERGHFRCLHAHCTGRSDSEFLAALGIDVVADDFDVVSDEEVAAANDEAASNRKYTFDSWGNTITQQPLPFIVKGVLPQAALTVIYGESGSGKTFFALDIACSVARGEPWRGLHVKPGRVAYIAAEDAHGVAMRLKAYALQHGVMPGDMDLLVLSETPNFTKVDDVKEVIKALQHAGEVSLVFVDTLAQVTAGSDENSAEDMGKLLGYCRSIHRVTGAMVVLIHHSGKDASKGARGHSSLRGAADCMIEVVRSDSDRVATIYKLKNAQDGAEFGFRLLPVVVGTDEDGDEVTSCVLEHTAEAKAKRAKEVRGENERIVLRVLDTLTIGGDKVDYAALKQHAIDQKPFDSNEGRKDRRGEVMARAIQNLLNDGKLVTEGGKIWSAE